jgi:hypothetical protein
VGIDERLEPAGIEKIVQVRESWRPQLAVLKQKISKLEYLAMAGKSREIIELLCQVVPTFQPLRPPNGTPSMQAQEHLVLVPEDRA